MGMGVPKDMQKTIQYYPMGADARNIYALNALGMCYKNGDSVPQNYDKAFELFMQAAAVRNYAAEYNVGLAYEMVQGVPEGEGFFVKYGGGLIFNPLFLKELHSFC